MGLAPTVLAGLAEGAWCAVLYAAWQVGLAHEPAVLGPLALAVPAWVGIWWVRSGASPDREAVGLVALTAGAVLLGIAVHPAGLSGLLGGNPTAALGAAPAGSLAGLALLRGARHRNPELDDVVTGGLLGRGLPLLALPWLVGSTAGEPWRSAFIIAAFPATLLFVTAALLAVGFARLAALARDAGLDWRQERTWFVVALGVIGVMAVVAVPAALLLGAPLGTIAGGLLGPLADLLLVVMVPLLLLAAPLLALVAALQGHGPPSVPSAGSAHAPLDLSRLSVSGSPIASAVLVVLVAALAIWAAWALARWFGGRDRPPIQVRPAEAVEERSLALPAAGLLRPRFRLPRRRRRRPPLDAAEAYLAFLEDLEPDPARRRRPSEDPGAHAARLRRDAGAPLAASLLAADFELERYGNRRLSGLETRRALDRRHRLRAWLRP